MRYRLAEVIVVSAGQGGGHRAIETQLGAAGFGVHSVQSADASTVLDAIHESRPDVLVFTPNAESQAGDWDAIAGVRRGGFVGAILVVGRRLDAPSAVAALECGADDYVAISCDPAELVARVRALARRVAGSAVVDREVGGLALDLRHGVLRAEGVEVALTRRETDLLDYLARNVGRPVTRAELATEIWRMRGDNGTNVVDVYVSYLRRKLGSVGRQSLIRSVRGVGYELVDTP
jgi:DNA-binding response OmpR family regulator